jgi:hypothetical protein
METSVVVFFIYIFCSIIAIPLSLKKERDVRFKNNCSEFLKEEELYLKSIQKSF